MGKGGKKTPIAAGSCYITRTQALKKLQLKLAQFRRLCILKGIYPVQPKNLKSVTKGDTSQRTFYLRKDITHLGHEPLLQKFRDFSVYARKLRHIQAQQRLTDAERFQTTQPEYSLDHLVKERYPSFVEALRDLDDALCLIFLFAKLPQLEDQTKKSSSIPLVSASGAFDSMNEQNCAQICSKLADEFMFYVIQSHSLRKCFISIKGIYYQADVQGVPVTWIVPHSFSLPPSAEVDFRTMHTFLEFYATLLGFVNFRLFKSLSLVYPPEVSVPSEQLESQSSLSHLSAKHTEGVCVPVELDQQGLLFDGLVFFICREVPRTPFEFVIRAFGGTVAWDGPSSPFQETDAGIHFQVMDRPSLPDSIGVGRMYVQPQFVFDCVNQGMMLDAHLYAPGKELPPHLSPFVATDSPAKEEEEEENDEIERGISARLPNDEIMDELNQPSDSESETDQTATEAGQKSKAKLEKERKAMALSMLSNRQRELYNSQK